LRPCGFAPVFKEDALAGRCERNRYQRQIRILNIFELTFGSVPHHHCEMSHMSRPIPTNVSLLAAALTLLVSAPHALADVKVHGATTVTFGLMRPHKEAIEKKAGVGLVILPSSTSRGLTDLAQGRADIAMLAEPLESAAESLNQKQPGAIKADELMGKHVGNAYVEFIVHPSNPVKSLSKEQLAGLFSGKVKNWSEVGGADQPVLLVGEPTSSPHKMIKDALSVNYPAEMRPVQNTNQTAVIVAQAPGALSYITTAHDLPERGKLKVVESEVKLPLALYLAFRKDAPDEVKKVVEAASAAGK
jgi:phosphate transport system substrate-binding protein